ncbi:cell division inhibitor [Gracilibacillus boraciitolerans JCM 21714]|uniref:Cell division inhibitor n=1 Tax=Gracilibacillus boraciitolerans JCM 21714 TaxID=1298598 RepID=W4VPN4_9BACI|nr:TIGR01777 family oxidoreductase [Gracilibacillus boraciitolerans]GAE95126.1 cell division inhibitor [Gracilibacillus boraciitolerans JCM 21714]
MKIAIAGGTGFVGEHLTKALIDRGDMVYILTRSPDKHTDTANIKYVGWLSNQFQPEKELSSIDGIINLAGDSLFGYWTKAKKDKIYQSRVNSTYAIGKLIEKLEKKPAVLINASAVGYFGTSETETFTEHSEAQGKDFLAEVTEAWEKTVLENSSPEIRTVIARFGVILGEEGALPLMAMPFKFFVGGKIGSGKQWISWVHIDDVVGLLLFALDRSDVDKVLHVTAPEPVQNKELSASLANVLGRPNWFPTPSFLLKTILGEMSTLIVEGQKVLPEKALNLGYQFHYVTIDKALNEIYD